MEDFKSSLVGKFCNLKDEIKKLPGELRKRWVNRKFILFLNAFKDIISKVPTDKRRKTAISTIIRDKINPVLPFLSELGYSFDNVVHKLIHECYQDLSKLCDDLGRLPGELPRRVASSSSKYLVKILCSKRKKFCTEDFMKQHLALISGRWEEQTLKEEEEMRLEMQKQKDLSFSRFFGHTCVLLRTALNFMDKLYIYPLDSTTFPERPGVYFIYHVGKTQLYEGLKPGRSLHTLSRLCRNLTRALQIASKTIAKKLRGQVNKSNRPKVNRQTRRDIQKGNTRRESNSQKMKKRKRKK